MEIRCFSSVSSDFYLFTVGLQFELICTMVHIHIYKHRPMSRLCSSIVLSCLSASEQAWRCAKLNTLTRIHSMDLNPTHSSWNLSYAYGGWQTLNV